MLSLRDTLLFPVSLAIADMIVGFLLFATVIPNIVWIRSMTEKKLLNFTIKSSNSASAVMVGSLLVVSTQVCFQLS